MVRVHPAIIRGLIVVHVHVDSSYWVYPAASQLVTNLRPQYRVSNLLLKAFEEPSTQGFNNRLEIEKYHS